MSKAGHLETMVRSIFGLSQFVISFADCEKIEDGFGTWANRKNPDIERLLPLFSISWNINCGCWRVRHWSGRFGLLPKNPGWRRECPYRNRLPVSHY